MNYYFSAHLRVVLLWSRTLCFHILAKWNSCCLNPFLILLMIQPLPLSSAGRPRQQDAVWAARSHPRLAGAEACSSTGSTALLSQGRGCRVRKDCGHPSEHIWTQTIKKVLPKCLEFPCFKVLKKIFSVSMVFLSPSLLTVCTVKHSNLRI